MEEALVETDEEPSYSSEDDIFVCDSDYEDDFDTSSESEDKDTNVGSCAERFSTIKEDLENGICIEYPENQRLKVQYVSRSLDVLMRNSQLLPLKESLNGSRLVTDMYGIYRASPEENGESVPLPLVNCCSGDVRIFVTIRANCSQHVNVFAHLRRNTGSWVKVPATLQDGVAEFEGGAFDILFLTSEPISETFILDPLGKEYICEHDKNIKMIFPQNCVQQRETLTVQIIPLSNNGPVYMDKEPCIIGATKSVHVKHRKGIFRKPIEMELDLYLFDDSLTPDLTRYSFIDVHAVNKQTREIAMYELTSQNYKTNSKGFTLHMEVNDFDSHSVQLAQHRKLITETGKLRARMAHDEIFHCHILVFITKCKHDYQGESLRIECVEQKQVQDTIDKLKNIDLGFVELRKCRSPPLFIEDGERIRISLRGGIKLPVGFRKDQMVITFLREGLHKHIVFPVETHFGNRPTSLGYIDFNRLDGKKELLYETFFDVDISVKKMTFDASLLPSLTSSRLGSRASSAAGGPYIASSRASTYSDGSVRTPSPDDQQYMVPNIMDKVICTVANMLPPTDWKFVLRSIIGDSCVAADTMISQAEFNSRGDLKETIYQSLKSWTHKTNLKTRKQIFDAIIQGLKNENYIAIASELNTTFENDV
ncbi:uncharacterized protein [Argopecten irradians]|uniref:uncharacterized protein isoform X2 n=1 Tax=Argopecten irradians TaxID=31199 RepID=UPI003721FA2C